MLCEGPQSSRRIFSYMPLEVFMRAGQFACMTGIAAILLSAPAAAKNSNSKQSGGSATATSKPVTAKANSITGPIDGTGPFDYKGRHKGKTK